MGQRGHGYGSEDHFIRYRTDHPAVLDSYIKAALPHHSDITWLYPAQGRAEEPKDLTFVDLTESQLRQWRAFWPKSGEPEAGTESRVALRSGFYLKPKQ